MRVAWQTVTRACPCVCGLKREGRRSGSRVRVPEYAKRRKGSRKIPTIAVGSAVPIQLCSVGRLTVLLTGAREHGRE